MFPKNFIRTDFRGNYNRWLSETTCFSYLNTGHVSKNYPTRSLASSNGKNKGKEKVNVEKVKVQMNKTWKKNKDCST